MPQVTTSIQLVDVSAQDVWPILKDCGEYPTFMEDVLQVDVLQRSADSVVSQWCVLLNGSELRWIEKESLIDNVSITFEQMEGDLEVWHGVWSIEPTPEGITIKLDVVFDLGIPSLAEILDPIGVRAVKANSLQMLEAIRAKLSRRDS